MGNVISQTNDNLRSYDVDVDGNLSLKNTLYANTGVFANDSYFKKNIIVDGTVDGVDISELKNTLNSTIDGLSDIKKGIFNGPVSALSFTGTSAVLDSVVVNNTGSFRYLKTTSIDVDGNISSSGLLSANGGINTTSLSGTSGNFTSLLSANGGINTTSLTGTSGNFSDGITSTSGNFTSLLSANGGINTTSLSGTSGNFSGSLSTNGLTSTSGNFTNLTFNGSMTGTGNINLGQILQINQTTTPTYNSKNAMTGNNGLIIKGTNKWSIGEVISKKGVTRLCFSYEDIPFACIDSVNKNLIAADDPNW